MGNKVITGNVSVSGTMAREGAPIISNSALAAAYDATATYAQGAYCVYDGKLYRAKADISTAEAWTAAHWQETSASAEDLSLFAIARNQWKQVYNTNGRWTLDYDYVCMLSIPYSDTIYLRSITGDFKPEYRAFITNTNSVQLTFTFDGVTSIVTNDEDNVIIDGNTLKLTAGYTIEVSILNGKMVAIVF